MYWSVALLLLVSEHSARDYHALVSPGLTSNWSGGGRAAAGSSACDSRQGEGEGEGEGEGGGGGLGLGFM